MLTFYQTSKNIYRRVIDGKSTKEVYHSVKAIFEAYAGKSFKVENQMKRKTK